MSVVDDRDRGRLHARPARPRRHVLRRRAPRAGRLGDLAQARGRGLREPRRQDLGRTRPEGPRRGVRLRRRDQAEVRRAGRGEGRRHPGEQHLPGRLPQRQPAHPGQRAGRGAATRRRAGAVPRLLVHLPEVRRRSPSVEDSLLTGHLEPTNDAYAIAKIAGILQVQAVRRQYGLPWISAMPTNLYGPNDNFSPTGSHVLPALIRRYDEAARVGCGQRHQLGHGHTAARVPARRRHGRCVPAPARALRRARARSTSAPAPT